MKKTLLHGRFMRMLDSVRNCEGQGRLFLRLLENAKQTASDDITNNSPEYRTEWDREAKLRRKVEAVLEDGGIELFEKYVEAAEETNGIWAEEMYLRGLQDGILFMTMAGSRSAAEITGIYPDSTHE